MVTSTGITVPGTASGSVITVTTGTGDYLKLARQMANALASASIGSTLNVASVTAGSAVPATIFVGTNEMAVTGSGGVSTTVPSSWNYVVNLTSSPDTIVSSNNQVLSGDQGATIIETGTNTVVATGGNNFVQDTGNYVISTGLNGGNDTIFASGSGTVGAGAGANFVSVSGTSNFVVSAGVGDTIRQGSGPTSVLAVGTGAQISGSSNPADRLTVSLGGSGNTLYANQTQASVTISGYNDSQSVFGGLYPTTSGANNVVEGGSSPGGSLSVVDFANFALITGNADSIVSATVSGNSSSVYGGSGTLNVSASGSNDTVAAGTAISNVTLSGSAAYLFGNGTASGTLTALDNSNGSTIELRNQASSTITLGGSSSVVDGGTNTAAALNISVTGSNDTVYAGAGTENIQTTTNALVFAPNGNGSLNFVGGSGGIPTVIGGANGIEHITVGGSGMDFSSGVNDNTTITAGTGQATIFGQSGGNVLLVGTASGGAQFHAYAGNETLNGSGSPIGNYFYGSSVAGSTTQMIGGSGSDVFIGGATAQTMTGGGQNDIFAVFAQSTSLYGGAHVTITDFNATDTLFLVGYDSTKSAASLLAHATGPGANGTGAGLTLTLSDNTTVTFTNLTSETPLFGRIGYFS